MSENINNDPFSSIYSNLSEEQKKIIIYLFFCGKVSGEKLFEKIKEIYSQRVSNPDKIYDKYDYYTVEDWFITLINTRTVSSTRKLSQNDVIFYFLSELGNSIAIALLFKENNIKLNSMVF